MQRLACPTCGNEVFFDSLRCIRCETALAFEVGGGGALTISDAAVVGSCAMRTSWRCNWRPPITAGGDADGTLRCASCRIVDAGQHDTNPLLVPFLTAQRRALAQLSVLGIFWAAPKAEGATPLDVDVDPAHPPLRFTYRSSSAGDQATIGHLGGLITLDLDEADPAQREQIRATLGEQYRTPLGHVRHELGHYVWLRDVAVDPQALQEFRAVFGDETVDYRQALDAHYARIDDRSWKDNYVSFYASSHPWEDFAESWAQVMHIHDVVSTGSAWGIVEAPSAHVRSEGLDVDGGQGEPRRQRARPGAGHARPLPVRPVARCPPQDRGGVAPGPPVNSGLTRRCRVGQCGGAGSSGPKPR